jgi:lipoic acid synthetase
MRINQKPEWLKIRLQTNDDYLKVKKIVTSYHLHTICESGSCPNKNECWGRGVASFLILGNICTRSCKFCDVATGKPAMPDAKEPESIAESIKLMNLRAVVITSVDRDDLPDLGADFWVSVIEAVRKKNPNIKIEALIPDFQGNTFLIDKIIKVHPDIISHNIETVKRLTPYVRSIAQYNTSLKVLNYIASANVACKSGIMLGLGETENEVIETFADLRSAGCDILTIGQYMQPSKKNIPVYEYIPLEKFEFFRNEALRMGFRHVESAPLVRSSYYAEKHFF